MSGVKENRLEAGIGTEGFVILAFL